MSENTLEILEVLEILLEALASTFAKNIQCTIISNCEWSVTCFTQNVENYMKIH